MKPSALLAVACAAASLPRSTTASRTDADNLHIGCWDDQFNGTASTTLLVSPGQVVVSYVAYPPPYVHEVVPEYTSLFVTNNPDVDEQGVSFVTTNADGTFSDFDMMIDSSDDEKDVIYYCQIDFNDSSAEEAAKEDDNADYTDFEKGCNGFPWSKMRRTDSDDSCKDLIAEYGEDDQAPTAPAGAPSDTPAPAPAGDSSSALAFAVPKSSIIAVVSLVGFILI
ncbi:hypothetical protein ACHAWF_016074 [Thalassiosira exigua]